MIPARGPTAVTIAIESHLSHHGSETCFVESTKNKLMRMIDVLDVKRRGGALSKEQLAFFVREFTAELIPDYQAAALLMAICLNGMTADETMGLTTEMLESGARFDFSHIDKPKTDKHSTGGVGDKTSFIVAPLAAACGLSVPMISGRALGHTGGTLDKLETIPGLTVELDASRVSTIVETVGCVIAGQTGNIAPADRRLYALRDVTCTVKSVPLITASILSKKLAEGIETIVFDVKQGNGAYMKTPGEAEELAISLTDTAAAMGVDAVALLTDMDQPLGTCIGNALEIEEALEILGGAGPQDLRELSLALVAEMLRSTGMVANRDEGVETATRMLDSGKARETFQRMVEAQDGDPECVESPELLPCAANELRVDAPHGGRVAKMHAEKLGVAAMMLGAGRNSLTDTISPGAGIRLHCKVGSDLAAGEPMLTLYADQESLFAGAVQQLNDAIVFGDGPDVGSRLIHDRIAKERTA